MEFRTKVGLILEDRLDTDIATLSAFFWSQLFFLLTTYVLMTFYSQDPRVWKTSAVVPLTPVET